MIQLKCQTFGFTKYKNNVLLLYYLHSWDHLLSAHTLGPLYLHRRGYKEPTKDWSQQNMTLVVSRVSCHVDPSTMIKTSCRPLHALHLAHVFLLPSLQPFFCQLNTFSRSLRERGVISLSPPYSSFSDITTRKQRNI